MSIYRKKPVEIQAFRLGYEGEPTAAPDWFNPDANTITDAGIIIHTLEGSILASWGDYIIRGVKGELYPVKPDIFEMTYEFVSPE